MFCQYGHPSRWSVLCTPVILWATFCDPLPGQPNKSKVENILGSWSDGKWLLLSHLGRQSICLPSLAIFYVLKYLNSGKYQSLFLECFHFLLLIDLNCESQCSQHKQILGNYESVALMLFQRCLMYFLQVGVNVDWLLNVCDTHFVYLYWYDDTWYRSTYYGVY